MGRQPEKRYKQGWPEQPYIGDLCRREESKEGTHKEAEESVWIYKRLSIF